MNETLLLTGPPGNIPEETGPPEPGGIPSWSGKGLGAAGCCKYEHFIIIIIIVIIQV